MRRFQCPNCWNEVHFSNTQCVRCATLLGYQPVAGQMLAVAGDQDAPHLPGRRPCANRAAIACNWVCEDDSGALCLSCAHTTKIPDISDDRNRERWASLELDKRRLLYAMIKFRLPLGKSPGAQEGFLHFELLADAVGPDGKAQRIMTGHHRGRITINIAEADDAFREKVRTEMGEPYRTALGHFRHEVAHYYWDLLVAGTGRQDAFRACFGDERRDYSEALEAYYRDGPLPDWPKAFVSAYASAHPWEDFAETWAHYFHMVGGLETAYAYGLSPQSLRADEPRLTQIEDPYHVKDVQELIDHWIPLTVAMNAMNRSIGHHDFYPFVLSAEILGKLRFIHDLIAASEVPYPVA